MSVSLLLHGASIGACVRCRDVALLTYSLDNEKVCSGCGLAALNGCANCHLRDLELFPNPGDRTLGRVCAGCLDQISVAPLDCWRCHKKRALYSGIPGREAPVCEFCFFRFCAREKICGDCGGEPKNLRFRSLGSLTKHRICSGCKARSIDYSEPCLECSSPAGRRRHRYSKDGVFGWICYRCYQVHVVPRGKCKNCNVKKPLPHVDAKGEGICETCNDNCRVGKSRCERCGNRGYHSRWHPMGKRFGRVCANCHPILKLGRRKCPRCDKKRVIRLAWPGDTAKRRICQSCYDKLTRIVALCSGPCGKIRELSCIHPDDQSGGRVCEPCFKFLTAVKGQCWKCKAEATLYRTLIEEKRRGKVCKRCYYEKHYPRGRCAHCSYERRLTRNHPTGPNLGKICHGCSKNYSRYGTLDRPK